MTDNSNNIFSKLEEMKHTIENMTKNHQIEILKILKKYSSIKINENKSGIFINLSFLPETCLQEIHNYLLYVHDQENLLLPLECQKNEYKNEFFSENHVETIQ